MLKRLLIVPAIALGILAFVLLGRSNKGPVQKPPQELARTVRVLPAPKLDVIPRAIGYGEARPGRVWLAVPEVSGRIIRQDPRLREGNIFAKGAELVVIDPADYKLEVQQADAQLLAIDAQLAQLTTQEETLGKSLEIEENSADLARAELERVQALVKKGSVSEAEVDKEQRAVLTQRTRVQEFKNSLTMIAPQRKVLDAQRSLELSRLAKAKLAVERTVIRAPFDCRIGSVEIEQDQVVQKGQTLFSADGIDSAEVTAQIAMRGLRNVMTAADRPLEMVVDAPEEALKALGLGAEVRFQAPWIQHSWKAQVVRVRGIDSQTRTLGMDVSVPFPYREIVPGSKPPLVRGMYVEVEIRGHPLPGRIVVPRSALREGHVFVVDKSSRLEPRPVEIAFVQSRFACIRSGLAEGERVVLSDIAPAVAGMLLDPVTDEAALAGLRDDAAGKTSIR